MRYPHFADFSIYHLAQLHLHMANYDLLPIYKITYDFLLEVFSFSKSFTREYKYTIWQELKNETIRLILAIYRANGSQAKRYELLDDARTRTAWLPLSEERIRHNQDAHEPHIRYEYYIELWLIWHWYDRLLRLLRRYISMTWIPSENLGIF